MTTGEPTKLVKNDDTTGLVTTNKPTSQAKIDDTAGLVMSDASGQVKTDWISYTW